MKLKYMLCAGFNLVRILFLKLIHGSSISIKPFQLISRKTTIDIGSSGQLKIKGRIHTEPNVFMSVKNGELFLGDGVYINRNTMVVCRNKIVIESGSTIGPNVCIYDHNHDIMSPGDLKVDEIYIGKNVWIGSGCIILKGVRIGNNCVVAAGTIVTKSVPDNCIIRTQLNNHIVEIEKQDGKKNCNCNEK